MGHVLIIAGRCAPSLHERDAIAAVFGLTRDQIAWGHQTPIQHLYGHGPGLKTVGASPGRVSLAGERETSPVGPDSKS